MSIVKEEYENLTPQGERLCDVVVLAQAWKKSHTYIRRHNWYSDVLELDMSTIDLENKLAEWAEALKTPEFRPAELMLVPAPKNTRWIFRQKQEPQNFDELAKSNWNGLFGLTPPFEYWVPAKTKVSYNEFGFPQSNEYERNAKLRPLAHLSIRDQTLMTAAMMCLAEAVESAQGDTMGDDVSTMRKAGVVSYGNRLDGSWSPSAGGASRFRFSWGNSRTYRQYFQDYRTFLARPRRVCAELVSSLESKTDLYVVSLDIKSFFDRIDRDALISELRKLDSEHSVVHGLPDQIKSDSMFWDRLSKLFAWEWREEDHQKASLISSENEGLLDLGLPQGLMASGFFANAYMVRFDRSIHQATTEGVVIDPNIKLLDYCRYVDDMRIVVEVKKTSYSFDKSSVLEAVKKFIEKELRRHCEIIGANVNLELSEDKCVATPYKAISTQSHVSALMETLNAELSGTFDMESLTQAAGGLDGLLWMSEQIETSIEPLDSPLSLATIAVPNTDVRDDTVKRFVATRISQLMRQRLAMTDLEGPVGNSEALTDNVTQGVLLSHEFESTGRKLIKCWAENPALVLLLRCGLDLFPHPKLLRPVIEAINTKLFDVPEEPNIPQKKEVLVAEYVLADLFRAGAVETGFRHTEEYPEGVDIAGYREELGAVARCILTDRPTSPWYLRQQARLFLASIGDMSLATSKETLPEVKIYADLQRAALYEPVEGKKLSSAIPLALVTQQLQPNPRRFGVWFVEAMSRTTLTEKEKERVVLTVASSRPDLLIAALNVKRSAAWRVFVPTALIEASKKSKARGKQLRSQTLLQLILGPNNLFDQENSLLMLASALLRYPEIENLSAYGVSAAEIVLECDDWSRLVELPNDADFLKVAKIHRVDTLNPLYSCPPWVAEQKAWLYGLGRILRSALTGEFDFTSRRYLVTEDIGHYSGLRSTWFKRRFGMLNSGQGLLDEPGPVSPWLSGLLSTLLQWPGVEFRANSVSKVGMVKTPSELLMLIDERVTVQRKLFGYRSKTPMYVVPVDDHEPLQDRPLRVAIVQPMRPMRDEFNPRDLTHWTAGTLAEHRRHLAEVCRLTHQKLKTWTSAKGSGTAVKKDEPVVDVILFPELAVHPEHVFLLRRLSDKLRANMFAGLTFFHSNKAGGVVNQGLWLIRTESPGHGRSFQYVWQGKKNPMKEETKLGVKGHRPSVTLVELPIGSKSRTRIAAAICYDATDLDLVSDLRDRSDMFLVAALNQDVQTFDNMVAALHFHMYQPVILANSGEFGGSTAQIPLPKHERLIAHVHGGQQVAVSVFEVDPSPFKSLATPKASKTLKAHPAGYKGRD